MAGMCPAHGGSNNQDDSVNFFPNDQTAQGAPAPAPETAAPPLPLLENAWVKAYDTSEADHYSQPGNLYRLMSDDQKNQLVNNIADGLIHASKSAQERMLAQFAKVDADYASRVSKALNQRA